MSNDPDDHNPPGRSEFATVEPRCKICQSEHRRAIDIMLAMGWPQATVRKHWNRFLGADYFTANNLSAHTRRHLHPTDHAISSFLDRCAERTRDRGRTEFEAPARAPSRVREAAELIARSGLAAIHAGLVVPEVKDMLAALELLGKMEAESFPREKAEMLREVRALIAAVKAVAPADLGNEIHEEYLRRLADLGDEGAAQRPRWTV